MKPVKSKSFNATGKKPQKMDGGEAKKETANVAEVRARAKRKLMRIGTLNAPAMTAL